jgi:hypothetical protein
MTVPIAIFKEQQDPVIGPEWTYPGIYENKIACVMMYTYELFEMEKNGTLQSPLQKHILANQINKRIRRTSSRLGMMKLREAVPMTKDRGASAAKKATPTGGTGAPAGAAKVTPAK